jgi:hypothetical protein
MTNLFQNDDALSPLSDATIPDRDAIRQRQKPAKLAACPFIRFASGVVATTVVVTSVFQPSDSGCVSMNVVVEPMHEIRAGVSSPAPQYREWFDYLHRLERSSTLVSRKMLNAVKDIWHSMSPLPAQPPHAGPSEDGCAYAMVWDAGRHHLEIELEGDTFAWLYRDREADEYAGGEVPTVAELIAAIKPYLPSFA